jgi:hypothetical protein
VTRDRELKYKQAGGKWNKTTLNGSVMAYN